MALTDDTLLALGAELLGWRTDTPAGVATVLADLGLLHQLHQRTALEQALRATAPGPAAAGPGARG